MKKDLKTKINQVKFLLSSLEKTYFAELVSADLLTKTGRRILITRIDQILLDEDRIIEELKRRKLSILQKIEKFVSYDYKSLLKKAKDIYETIVNDAKLKKIEKKFKNV